LKDLDALKFVSAYPQDAILFMETQASRGLYVLCEGEVKLSISSPEGKTLILRIAKSGEVLGLAGTLAGIPHEVTAETLRPCQVAFIRGSAFLRFLARHPEAYPAVAKQLGTHYQVACEQLRTVALCASSTERLAKLLLEFSTAGRKTKQGTWVKWPLTHEEIGEFIGTTRETVTRMLGDLKRQNLVTIQGSNLLIQDRPALEKLATA
jgi:CRP/FNR family transcriptional regulator